MFKSIKGYLLKKLYKFLIFKTIVLDKDNACSYKRMEPFCEISIDTDKGPFKFIFKEDRRKHKRRRFGIIHINNFIIELLVPEGIVSSNSVIENKVVIVIKIMLFKINYTMLTEVLTDIYLDNILEYIRLNEVNA